MSATVATHLPVDVYSPDQLSSLIVELRTYRGKVRDTAVRAKAGSKSKVMPQASDSLASLLHANGVNETDSPSLEALYNQLAAALKAAPVMHVTLAAPAGRMLKRQLTVWFRASVHPTALLTFAARGDIGGGIILQAGSHVYDYSFRNQILSNKARLTGLASV